MEQLPKPCNVLTYCGTADEIPLLMGGGGGEKLMPEKVCRLDVCLNSGGSALYSTSDREAD